MILTCPQCATSYFVPDEAMGASGRRVRCQSCANTWHAAPEEPLDLVATTAEIAGVAPAAGFGKRDDAPESLAETPAPELPKAYRARAEQQRRLRRAAAHGAVWAGLGSGFAALLIAGWLFRVDVVEMYPRAAAAYAFVGSPVNPTGLEFEAVNARASPNNPGMVLISGAVRNVRDREIVSPSIRVALLNASGREIGHQVVPVHAAPVLPGKVLGFAALAPDPNGRAADIGVTFVLDEAEPPSAPAPVAPAARRPAPAAPLASAPAAGLRPAMDVYPRVETELEPIDAEPIEAVALDTDPDEAVSASHHG